MRPDLTPAILAFCVAFQGLQALCVAAELCSAVPETEVLQSIATGQETSPQQSSTAAHRAAATRNTAESSTLANSDLNARIGFEFLETNRSNRGIFRLPNGLQYKILMTGKGRKPGSDDIVTCLYRGTLLDGTEFANSGSGAPVIFKVSDAVISAWSQALPLMPTGSRWRLFIPPGLAYGEQGAERDVGPNETVITDLELVAVHSAQPKVSQDLPLYVPTLQGLPSDLESQWGIRFTGIKPALKGSAVEVRYMVTDAVRAAQIADGTTTAYLAGQDNGARIMVCAPRHEAWPFPSHSRSKSLAMTLRGAGGFPPAPGRIKTGMTYTLMVPNPEGAFKAGSRAAIEAGQLKSDILIVE